MVLLESCGVSVGEFGQLLLFKALMLGLEKGSVEDESTSFVDDFLSEAGEDNDTFVGSHSIVRLVKLISFEDLGEF